MVAHHQIDVSNFPDAFALLKIMQILRKAEIGERVAIRGCDPGMKNDLIRILPVDVYQMILSDKTAPAHMELKKTGDF